MAIPVWHFYCNVYYYSVPGPIPPHPAPYLVAYGLISEKPHTPCNLCNISMASAYHSVGGGSIPLAHPTPTTPKRLIASAAYGVMPLPSSITNQLMLSPVLPW